MTIFLIISALTNMTLGYGLAVFLGKSHAPLALSLSIPLLSRRQKGSDLPPNDDSTLNSTSEAAPENSTTTEHEPTTPAIDPELVAPLEKQVPQLDLEDLMSEPELSKKPIPTENVAEVSAVIDEKPAEEPESPPVETTPEIGVENTTDPEANPVVETAPETETVAEASPVTEEKPETETNPEAGVAEETQDESVNESIAKEQTGSEDASSEKTANSDEAVNEAPTVELSVSEQEEEKPAEQPSLEADAEPEETAEVDPALAEEPLPAETLTAKAIPKEAEVETDAAEDVAENEETNDETEVELKVEDKDNELESLSQMLQSAMVKTNDLDTEENNQKEDSQEINENNPPQDETDAVTAATSPTVDVSETTVMPEPTPPSEPSPAPNSNLSDEIQQLEPQPIEPKPSPKEAAAELQEDEVLNNLEAFQQQLQQHSPSTSEPETVPVAENSIDSAPTTAEVETEVNAETDAEVDALAEAQVLEGIEAFREQLLKPQQATNETSTTTSVPPADSETIAAMTSGLENFRQQLTEKSSEE